MQKGAFPNLVSDHGGVLFWENHPWVIKQYYSVWERWKLFSFPFRYAFFDGQVMTFWDHSQIYKCSLYKMLHSKRCLEDWEIEVRFTCMKITILQNWFLRLIYLPFAGVVFSCYFLKYGVWDLIVWSLIGPHILLISDWTAAKFSAECMYLVKSKSISFFNLTPEGTVCGQT